VIYFDINTEGGIFLVGKLKNTLKFVFNKNDKTMKLTLNIPNHNFTFFMQLLKNLNFDIKIEDEKGVAISNWHLPILEERLTKYETDTSGFVLWEDLKKGL
jgi:hypothetical protein